IGQHCETPAMLEDDFHHDFAFALVLAPYIGAGHEHRSLLVRACGRRVRYDDLIANIPLSNLHRSQAVMSVLSLLCETVEGRELKSDEGTQL
ncbi:MAG TPA: hypothetical protein VFS52_03780, partial [Steroidobacteraceae bacterium]|nr:hypothetical protein [Steroidobacteraceae bacterium]